MQPFSYFLLIKKTKLNVLMTQKNDPKDNKKTKKSGFYESVSPLGESHHAHGSSAASAAKSRRKVPYSACHSFSSHW